MSLFFNRIEMLRQKLVHSEHVYTVLFEDSSKSIIAHDLPLVVWILQFPSSHVLPCLLYDLRTRKLDFEKTLVIS